MSKLVAEQTLESGQVLSLVHGDLTEAQVDAIVNAANAQLVHGGGVAGAIVRKGGEEIQTESDAWIREHGPVAHDKPVITGAGSLPCRYVIHAVGPRMGEGDEERKLREATRASLALADAHGLKSIALPAVSTGIFGFPIDRCAQIMLETVQEYASGDTGLERVVFCLFGEEAFKIFGNAFAELLG